VYNSSFDDGATGLAKAGAGLPASTSAQASDHYLVFADFHMTDAVPVYAVDAVRNGGFELAGSTAGAAFSWEFGVPDAFGEAAGNVQRVDWRSRSGAWTAAFLGLWSGLGDAGEYGQELDAVPGIAYQLEAWFWADTGTFGGVWSADEQFMRLQFYASGQEVLAVTGAVNGVGEIWRRYSVSAIAPPGADRVRVSVVVAGAGADGAMQFDDVVLRGFAVDSDGDGLPDFWELRHFTHAIHGVGGDDADGDGLTNREEYLADTDPTNSLSSLQVTGVVVDEGGVRLDWTGGQLARQHIQVGQLQADGGVRWLTWFTNEPPTAVAGSVLLPATNAVQFIRLEATR
jgi:hypothetical protein